MSWRFYAKANLKLFSKFDFFLFFAHQVAGNPLQDRLTIAVAQELQRSLGGWVPPPNNDKEIVWDTPPIERVVGTPALHPPPQWPHLWWPSSTDFLPWCKFYVKWCASCRNEWGWGLKPLVGVDSPTAFLGVVPRNGFYPCVKCFHSKPYIWCFLPICPDCPQPLN